MRWLSVNARKRRTTMQRRVKDRALTVSGALEAS
jgi:hypothetical protein